METEEARRESRVLLIKTHRRLTSTAVLTVHAETSKLYTFQKKKAPIYRLSSSKAPKTQQNCHYRHTRKTSELFSLLYAGVDFSLRNNFANSGSFAKVSVPVHN